MISSMRGGGSEQQTLLLLRHLDRERFEPLLFLLERQGHLLNLVPDDVPVFCFQSTANSADRFPPGFSVLTRFPVYIPGRIFRDQVRQVRRLIGEQSIDVIYDRTYPMTLIASAAADPIDVPRVSTIVSPPDQAVRSVEKRFVAIKRRRLAAAYRRSHQVITVSDQSAIAAGEYYHLPRTAFTTIRNPVDRENLRRLANVSKTNSGDCTTDGGNQSADGSDRPAEIDRGGVSIVVVGRMTTEKGHRDLLLALAKLQIDSPELLRRRPVRLIGDGPLRQSLRELSVELNLPSTVRFEGHSANPSPAISTAQLLVLPSRFEGLPNVVLEAMSLRTAVVATLCGGTAELDPDPERPTMFSAPPGDPDSLAGAIATALRSPRERTRRIENAESLIEQNHDLRSAVDRISRCLLQAAASGE